MQTTNLDGVPVDGVIAGRDYLVPCVYGIPVICPSHVDEGTDGPTGRHWHTDDRFGRVHRGIEYWSQEEIDQFKMVGGDELRSDILRDNGEPVIMEQMKAEKSEVYATGAVFSSVCWLYENLGHKSSKDGQCVHHRTSLVRENGCLGCPAHGLKYQLDGQPWYKAPFFIAVRYIGKDHQVHIVKKPLRTGTDGVEFRVSGTFDSFPMLHLEDSDGTRIMSCRSHVRIKDSASILTMSIGAWPTDGKCPSLTEKDPR